MRYRVALPLALLAACQTSPAPNAPGLARVFEQTQALAAYHANDKAIPAICFAILDVNPITGESVTTAGAVGLADPARGTPATATTVHRVASISKLFTATAAMVLVEQGRLDLDVPVQLYVPEFAPDNPFGGAITMRQLLAHRAGIVREPPVGHYFDPSAPSLAATVHSLGDTELVHAPGSAFKYSNPGFGVAGEVIARVTGKPFEDAVRELVLTPLGLRDSDFAPRADLLARQAQGMMWTYDGRTIPTPGFPFGYSAAANLRSTVVDLLGFARPWLAAPALTPALLQPASLRAMGTPAGGGEAGCGIGFFVSSFDGHRRLAHDGAVYGFATALMLLPDEGLAAAVVCTRDFCNAVADAIAEHALRSALANRRGASLPPLAPPTPVGRDQARDLAGCWRCGQDWVELRERDGELFYDPNIGVRTRLRRDPRDPTGASLVSDDWLSLGGRRLQRLDGMLHDGMAEYVREREAPAPPPAELLPLLGEYGWDHNVLIVYEDHGRLGVLIEWLVRDLPDREGQDCYRFPAGLYGGDRLVFERDAAGAVIAATVGGARFPRRPDPPAAGFRIVPQASVAELQRTAALASPPPQPPGLLPFDLVDLATLDPTLQFEIRYASTDNFLGVQVYDAAVAKLQRPAAAALLRVHRKLASVGLGLRIFDAYRPWATTKVFFDATPAHQKHFVADPSRGSRHNRGCAVDLTLYELATGQPVEMPSGYDEFTPRAYPDYPGGTSRQRYHRELLRRAMEAEGFTVYEHEWWHFDYRDWQRYPVGNERLR